ncbi:microtubule-actin cross-linking factor 1-like [Anneissia japonica]|uniref:microtubule-actin cross-linking factor 1-like n=1 Tax=Anneissia japonica TaxID=1529436 RepID=UPI0014254B5E|nr:microtubule-actin cross-linking factor 1-like [Anneissia japonica]
MERLRTRDFYERDEVQKKTFTKWVNQNLRKVNKKISDLYKDFRDGHNLISLLEALSGEKIPRERGRLRVHRLQNVGNALKFLQQKKVMLVNIRSDEIVNGNPKLTLGLVWTIILHFQISDIVVESHVGEQVQAKDGLMFWAKCVTEGYPGVTINNFGQSWRDGLAFNAVLHRNRPDLIDFKSLNPRNHRGNLENAFSVAETVGVPRLLDPEDVDVASPDEKSILMYVSSLYDVFPKVPPPPVQQATVTTHTSSEQHSSATVTATGPVWEAYQQEARTLMDWIQKTTMKMDDRSFDQHADIKKLQSELTQLRSQDVPAKLAELRKTVAKYHKLDTELHKTGQMRPPSVVHARELESAWEKLITAEQQRETALQVLLSKSRHLSELGQKISDQIQTVNSDLDSVDTQIKEVKGNSGRMTAADIKNNIDVIEGNLMTCKNNIRTLFSNVQQLKEGQYEGWKDLLKRVEDLEKRVSSIETYKITGQANVVTQTVTIQIDPKLLAPISEHINWVQNKSAEISKTSYGTDLTSIQNALSKARFDEKAIKAYKSNVDRCRHNCNMLKGAEREHYSELVVKLEEAFKQLVDIANKRCRDAEVLQQFVEDATEELMWLDGKEDQEAARDWSAKNLDVEELEKHHMSLLREIETREKPFNAILERGQKYVLNHHPGSETMRAYMTTMQSQWSWLIQLSASMETQLKYAAEYHQFFNDARNCEQRMIQFKEELNSRYSPVEATVEEINHLLLEMEDMKDKILQLKSVLEDLAKSSHEVVPLKQRRQPLTGRMTVYAICNYTGIDMSVSSGEECVLLDNSDRLKWRVINTVGREGTVPGIVFMIPPPYEGAIRLAKRLEVQFQESLTLWSTTNTKLNQLLKRQQIMQDVETVKHMTLHEYENTSMQRRVEMTYVMNGNTQHLKHETSTVSKNGDAGQDFITSELLREVEGCNLLIDEMAARTNAQDKPKVEETITSSTVTVEQSSVQSMHRKTVLFQVTQSHASSESPDSKFNIADSIAHSNGSLDLCDQEVQDITAHIQQGEELDNSNVTFNPEDVDNDLENELDSLSNLLDEMCSEGAKRLDPYTLNEDITKFLKKLQELQEKLSQELQTVKLPADQETMMGMQDNVTTFHSNLASLQPRYDRLRLNLEEALKKEDQPETKDQLVVLLDTWEKLYSMSSAAAERISEISVVQASLGRAREVVENCEHSLLDQDGMSADLDKIQVQYDTLQELQRTLPPFQVVIDQLVKSTIKVRRLSQRAPLPDDHTLQKDVNEVKLRWDDVCVQTHERLMRLDLASDKLQEMTEYLTRESNWISEAAVTLLKFEIIDHDILTVQQQYHAARLFNAEVENRWPKVEDVLKKGSSFIDEVNVYDAAQDSYAKQLEEFHDLTATKRPRIESGAEVVQKELEIFKTRYEELSMNVTEKIEVIDSVGKQLNAEYDREYRTICQVVSDKSYWVTITQQKLKTLEPISSDLQTLTFQKDKLKSFTEDISYHEVPISETTLRVEKFIKLNQDKHMKPEQQKEIKEKIKGLQDGYRSVVSLANDRMQKIEDAHQHLMAEKKELSLVDNNFQEVYAAGHLLLKWLSDTEHAMGSHQPQSEQVQPLNEQLNKMKALKDDINAHEKPIKSSVDNIQKFMNTSGQKITRENHGALHDLQKQLYSRFDVLQNQADERVQHLTSALDYLRNFDHDLAKFEHWLGKTSHDIDGLVSDAGRDISVLKRQQTQLQGIASDMNVRKSHLAIVQDTGQRFIEDSKVYKQMLYDFRNTALPSQFNRMFSEAPDATGIQDRLVQLDNDFTQVEQKCGNASKRLDFLITKHQYYNKSLESAMRWLDATEKAMSKLMQEPIAAETQTVQEQTEKFKAFNDDVIKHSKDIEDLKDTGRELSDAQPEVKSDVQKTVGMNIGFRIMALVYPNETNF